MKNSQYTDDTSLFLDGPQKSFETCVVSAPRPATPVTAVSDTHMCQTFKNQKGGTNVLCDGYSYIRSSRSLSQITWTCVHRFCKATLTTALDMINVIKHGGQHNHPSSSKAGWSIYQIIVVSAQSSS